MVEIWKKVNGFEARFEISNLGRLKSINGRNKGEKILVAAIDGAGYRHTSLRMKPLNKSVRIHNLVAEHFCEKEFPEMTWVNHDDGNKLNNNYTNLKWCTPLQNCQHAVLTGLLNIKGERHPQHKLTVEKVIEMRRLHKTGNYNHTQLGNMFGVCRRQAGDVINGVNWGWIKETVAV